ncbi:MAG: hypothetical protein EOO75_06685, partial [Myxococcales bacterium]
MHPPSVRTLYRAGLPAIACAGLLSFVPRAALAACPPRPTNPDTSSQSYSYQGAPVAGAEGERCIVWYATSGPQAPDLTAQTPPTPDVVRRAVEVVDDALQRYVEQGFRAVPGDGGSAECAGNIDDRLDVYLVAFAAADGLTVPEACTGSPPRCTSFVVAERAPEKRGYASFDEGARTILPHEVFHAVQNAYDVEIDRYWSEGSAQWATWNLHPDLLDLAHFAPKFLAELDRPLDLPPGGVTASFLYGSALWPVFLAQRHGPGVILEVMGAHGDKHQPSFEAVTSALGAHGATLPDEFALFSAWNAATGQRAAAGQGYARAVDYGTAPLSPDAPEGILAGFSARLHQASLPAGSQLTLAADPERVSASWLPLSDGRADLAGLVSLPATVAGDGVVVVSGRSSKKSDAAYRVDVTASPAPTATTTAPAPSATAPPSASTSPPPTPSAPGATPPLAVDDPGSSTASGGVAPGADGVGGGEV